MLHEKVYQPGRCILVRLEHGADLWESIRELVEVHGINSGTVQGLGAVSKAVYAFYHAETRQYETLEKHEDLEILNCNGNISLKDGKPFPHLHAIFSDQAGHCFGGHLLPGTVLFAGEFSIQELLGEPMERGPADPETGLPLWVPKGK